MNFSESGLFNGLRAQKLKKFPPAQTRLVSCARSVSDGGFLSLSPVWATREACSIMGNTIP
jgi:hypothetical protein